MSDTVSIWDIVPPGETEGTNLVGEILSSETTIDLNNHKQNKRFYGVNQNFNNSEPLPPN